MNKKLMVVVGILLANFIVIGIFLLNKPNPQGLAPDFLLTDVDGKLGFGSLIDKFR